MTFTLLATSSFLPFHGTDSSMKQVFCAAMITLYYFTKCEVQLPDAGLHHTKGELALSNNAFQHSDTLLSAATTKYSRDLTLNNCQMSQGKEKYKIV